MQLCRNRDRSDDKIIYEKHNKSELLGVSYTDQFQNRFGRIAHTNLPSNQASTLRKNCQTPLFLVQDFPIVRRLDFLFLHLPASAERMLTLSTIGKEMDPRDVQSLLQKKDFFVDSRTVVVSLSGESWVVTSARDHAFEGTDGWYVHTKRMCTRCVQLLRFQLADTS